MTRSTTTTTTTTTSTPLTRDEQEYLVKSLQDLSAEHVRGVVRIIRQATDVQDDDDEEILKTNVLDLDPDVQRELLRYVHKVGPCEIMPIFGLCLMSCSSFPCFLFVCLTVIIIIITQVERESESSLLGENHEVSHRTWPRPRA